jgi:hypothetical protein
MAKRQAASPVPRAGIPVDAAGGPTIDPTANVISLSAASNVRQDDLRAAANELVQMQFRLHEKIAQMREGAAKEREAAAKELAAAETRHVNEQLALRASYEGELRHAEAGRIDAIRAVDVNAVAVASQRAADAATVLQNNVTTSAETLRTLVASAATTTATTLQQLIGGLSTRITTLEQGSYQAQGKQSYSDPAFVELLTEVKQLREAARQGTGRNEGISTSWAIFIAAATLVVGIVGAGILFSRSQAPQIQPQIQYAPVGPLTPPAAK